MAGFQLWLGGGGGLDIVATTANVATSDRVEIHRVHRVRRVHRVPGSEKLNLRFRFSAPGVPKLGTSRF